jgi:hypothetical protein
MSRVECWKSYYVSANIADAIFRFVAKFAETSNIRSGLFPKAEL